MPYMWRITLKVSDTGMSHQSWVRWPNTTPMLRALAMRWRWGTIPPTETSPPVGTRMPTSILMVVDLPAPLGPM